MMEKVSLIAFSHNDTDKALAFVKDIYDTVDEIVLVDASDRREWKHLQERKNLLGYRKLRLFHILALGYPDPTFMLAYKLCKYRWVLYLDIDERPSATLAAELRKLVTNAKHDAFDIRRYEHVDGDNLGDLFTWQIHLSKKDKTLYRGLIHEQPTILGKIERLTDERYHIRHEERLQSHNANGNFYKDMWKFERLSYALYKATMLEHAAKLTHFDTHGGFAPLGRLINFVINVSERLQLKNDEDEIGMLDYIFMYALRNFVVFIRDRNLHKFIADTKRMVGYIVESRHDRRAEEIFGISKIIHTKGITKYLKLDDKKEIDKLTRKYEGKKQGLQLLISLMLDKYETEERKQDWKHKRKIPW